MDEWKSKLTRSQQRTGIKAALSDMAEMGFHLHPTERQKIDDILRGEALPTLTELIVTHGRRVKNLLKKKS
jgi:hypothetical protein